MGRRVSSKVSCTVLSGGKSGDNFKGLPIAITAEDRKCGDDVQCIKKQTVTDRTDYSVVCTA